ncbi:MAG: response regulator [Steroidobacteraceae bacterium]
MSSIDSPALPAQIPTVYIVDDDENMRRAIAAMLRTVSYDAIEFGRPEEFLANLDPQRHACVVLDIRMPGMSGLQVQQRLNAAGSILPVIFITGHGDIAMAVQAMKDGAFDFLTKPFREQELLDRINNALKLDAERRAALRVHADLHRRRGSLSQRELEVLAMIVDGKSNKTVAQQLGLSERTIEIHRANIMEKMGARSVAQLVKMYLALSDERKDARIRGE